MYKIEMDIDSESHVLILQKQILFYNKFKKNLHGYNYENIL